MELDIKNLDQLKSIGAAEESSVQYDVIPLPSKGIFYTNKKSSLRVSYLTASDENILLSPNLLESGKALDTLLERKILDRDININQLLVGDRDAILIFLRTSGYGSKYVIDLIDPSTGKKFEHEVDLSNLTYKEFPEPDQNNEYMVTLPISGSKVKFRFLTIGEISEIDDIEEKKSKMIKGYVDQTITARIERYVMEIDGDRDKGRISNFIKNMRIGDSSFLRKYYSNIEPGINLNLEVEAPSGEFFRSKLPINSTFFWPDIE